MLAPLVVVQPTLAVGLLVLLLIGERMLGEHAGRYEYLAMAAIVIGVIGAALIAPPRATTHRAAGADDHAACSSASALASLAALPAARDSGAGPVRS